MNKTQRQERLYLNPAELARWLGIPRVTLDYHVQQGYVPSPATRIGDRMYFDLAQVRAITTYFAMRRRYEHQADVFAK
jgi:predicted site-specific integrase-resolvase